MSASRSHHDLPERLFIAACAVGLAAMASCVQISALAQAPTQPSASPEVTGALPSQGVLSYVVRQGESQRLATGYIGKNVYGLDGQRIGDVSDIVLDTRTGEVPAVVIGVGGFLGLGEKDVAVPLSALRTEIRDGRPRFVLQTGRDDLRKAPAFVRTNAGQ